MPMAMIAPAATIHKGRFDGRFNASRTPVSTAEQSPIVAWRRSMYLVTNHSTATHDATDTHSTISAGTPKKYKEQNTAGSNASNTCSIEPRTVLAVCMCGVVEKISFSFISYHFALCFATRI